MTPEELNQYNALSEEDKSFYQRIKSRHPEWNHKQIMTKIAIESYPVTSGAIGGDVSYGESLWDKLKNFFR